MEGFFLLFFFSVVAFVMHNELSIGLTIYVYITQYIKKNYGKRKITAQFKWNMLLCSHIYTLVQEIYKLKKQQHRNVYSIIHYSLVI